MFDFKRRSEEENTLGAALRLVAYMGPALIVSVAYVDPGNFATDIATGSSTGYVLLWVVWLAGLMAMLLQYMSGKLGIATGHSLPELIGHSLKRRSEVIPYWLGAEAASAAVDLAEFLGTVLALNLLFGIPYLEASLIGVFDVFLLIYLAKKGMRRVEKAFMLFIGMISIGYIYELFLARPSLQSFAAGSFIPTMNSEFAVFAVSIIGATVMPHVLFLHSDLTRNKLKRLDMAEKKEMLRFHKYDTMIFLTVASFVNAAILLMAAGSFYSRHLTFVLTINSAYQTLRPLFGPLAGYAFIAALLSSGLSSSTTGTLAGQSVMEGLLGRKVNPWKRRLVTRGINVFPTTVALLLGFNPFFILFYSQVVLSLMIPLPMIPLILYSADRKLMGPFVNKRVTTVLAVATASIIILFNIYYIVTVI
jgi:manganese transport protein